MCAKFNFTKSATAAQRTIDPRYIMRMRVFIITALAVSSIIASCSPPPAAESVSGAQPSASTAAADAKQPVLVELFTSEGCSSCPPADKALTFLQTQQPVRNGEAVTLAFHVDYWDGPQWKDRFSSPEFSRRQDAYARQFKLDSSYTPQMIVDGETEFVGSNLSKANEAIASAAQAGKAQAHVDAGNGKVVVSTSDLAAHQNATVFMAIAENSLETAVKGGENQGQTLSHMSVVRELRVMGTIDAKTNSFKTELPAAANDAWNKANLKYVVFVQEDATLKVIAVGQAKGR